eukprot:SAG22_NODE_6320_length_870_cov_1.844358_2_plen_102_part_01
MSVCGCRSDLGKWDGKPLPVRYDNELLGDSWQMQFEHGAGTGCPSGAGRKSLVQLGCGPTEAVRTVAEPEPCAYTIRFSYKSLSSSTGSSLVFVDGAPINNS